MTEQNLVPKPLPVIIGEAKRKFGEIVAASDDPAVTWESESMFAMQILQKTGKAAKALVSAAQTNPDSLRNAVINIASVGLSLNPVTANAYLIPRDGEVCLDISYKGLIRLATDTGSIAWARADLVYSHDQFKYNGTMEKPEHSVMDMSDRGKFAGAYCVAKTIDGDFLTEYMTADQINQVKEASPAGKKGYGPWASWFGEMAKKAVIKRASKTWPKSDQNHRLETAISLTNHADGYQLDQDPDDYIEAIITDEQAATLTDMLEASSIDTEAFLAIKGVSKVSEIHAKDYKSLVGILRARGGK